jgi:hypothetical protein
MNAEDRPSRKRVTGVLVEQNDGSGMSPPDARVSHPKFFDVGSLLARISERLRNHEKVSVTVFPSDDETAGETHEVHLGE